MLNKKYIQNNVVIIIIVFILIFFPGKTSGNNNAIKLVKQKKYTEAIQIFTTLHQQNVHDPEICYYLGLCLTETNQFGKETISLLLKATNGNQPVDVNYYLGKNFHAMNDFKVAKSYYEIFQQYASLKEKKSFDLEARIDMCNRRINPHIEYKNKLLQNEQDSIDNSDKDTIHIDERTLEIPPELNDSTLNFTLTSEIYYTRFNQFKTSKGKWYFIQGWNSNHILNKLNKETDSLRIEYGKSISAEARLQISNRVIDFENDILNTKLSVDKFYNQASDNELQYWKLAPENEKILLIAENDSILKEESMKQKAIIDSIPVNIVEVKDTLSLDSIPVTAPEPVVEPVKTNHIVFKVQIGAYNSDIPESAKRLFKKIAVLRKIDQYIDDRNYTVFTIGELTNVKDAIRLQDQIRQESVKDAFVIAIKDGKRIPLNEALELLKQ